MVVKILQNKVSEILDKAVKINELKTDEIKILLQTEGKEFKELCQHASQLRDKFHGDEIHLRAIIEFSNYCNRNCKYCGLRKDNNKLTRYQLNPEQIIKMAEDAAQLGYKTVVLQSGEDNYNCDDIADIISKIKRKADIAVTLSLGERDYEEYKIWKKAGADRYLLKQETANKDLYNELHPDMKYDERIRRLKWLKELGYQVGSGNIIGLPGQKIDHMVEDIKLFKKLDLHMVGIGPFISHRETPLRNLTSGTVKMTLKNIAITRLLLPLSHIPATTALGSIDPEGRQKAIKAGANVVMPNVTETSYRPLYEIYPSKICINEKAEDCRQCIGGIINSLGKKVSTGYGHCVK
ncbi:MAG: [FeFe] hydrogenase H-cluster radical SAM maturase HydE [Halanaerobiaceae bacterium]